MEQPTGISHLYPAVPIMSFFAMISLLLLVHGFWKARIIALVAFYGWLFLEISTNSIGMIYWRGHTNDAPVLASILSILWRAQTCGLWTSAACFAHFTWQRLRPLHIRELYDTRRRNNLIHVFFTLILPLLWVPLHLVSSPFRYRILEDLGPCPFTREDWSGFALSIMPRMLGCGTIVIFTVLSLVNYWRIKREDSDSDIFKYHSSVRTRKLLLMAVINMLLAMYCVYRDIIGIINYKWTTPTSIAENIASLQIVVVRTRSDVDTSKDHAASLVRELIFKPLLAFYQFAWFGLGEETRKAYVEAFLKLGLLINATPGAHSPHGSTPTFSSSAMARLRAKFRQRLGHALFLVLPNPPQITPYITGAPPDDGPELPASPIRTQPSKPVRDRVDVKRQGRVPSREPARRLSIHKPPFAALNPANGIPSVSDIPLRQMSHHKPPFVPLAPPNAHVIATPGASGSAPREGAANNIRRQEKFASCPRARRLSYHKPAFVPLAPANVNTAVLQADNVVEDNMAPRPLSSVSTPTFPPPFSTPSTATPAPPYRDVNPFLGHVPQCTHE